jgi:hypothetical protein
MTWAMNKLVLALMAAGCWTSSSRSSAPSTGSPVTPESDAQYGGTSEGAAASNAQPAGANDGAAAREAQPGGTTDGTGQPANQLGALGSAPLEQGGSFQSLSGAGSGTATVPTVAVGQLATQGNLDKQIIRRYVARSLARIRYCYEKQLLADPTLQGTVTVQFVIGADGDVPSANGSGMHPEVASCVATAIKAIQFPKPAGGGSVDVRYPFGFRPS